MRIITLLLFITFQWLPAQEFTLKKGSLAYEFDFMMKTITGTSTHTKGKGKCENSNCQFFIGAPVKNFESGNTNRDLNMLKATKADKFPLVGLKSEFSLPEKSGTFTIKTMVNFASVKKSYTLKIDYKITNNIHHFNGNFKIKLSDFKIERPSLLAVKIPDEIKIQFQSEWLADI